MQKFKHEVIDKLLTKSLNNSGMKFLRVSGLPFECVLLKTFLDIPSIVNYIHSLLLSQPEIHSVGLSDIHIGFRQNLFEYPV